MEDMEEAVGAVGADSSDDTWETIVLPGGERERERGRRPADILSLAAYPSVNY